MLQDINKVVIIGAGGGANFYIAKFLRLCSIEVTAYDVKENGNIKELASLGCKVIYSNPETYDFNAYDLVIYTIALPAPIQKTISELNDSHKVYSAGAFYKKLVDAYELGEFNSNLEMTAFKDSNIAPLFSFNFKDCILIGITGSKGKTTTSNMLYQALTSLGVKTSLVSTLGARVLTKELETGLHTSTPSAQELAELFKQMLEAGSKVIVVEVSSHGIATGRITGLKFDIGVITNIQPEHLDFHRDIAEVIAVKETLITKHLKPSGKVILNYDDNNIRQRVLPKVIKRFSDINLISFSRVPATVNTLVIQEVKEDKARINFELTESKTGSIESYEIPYSGKFNIYNVVPTILVAKSLGFLYKDVARALLALGVVSGRNELVIDAKIKIILDFAHTAESLEAILQTYKEQCPGKLIVVFGCAGQRDTLKRPRMGEVAAKYADVTILAAEDPRTEDLGLINDQIEAGYNAYRSKHNLQDQTRLYRFDDTSGNTKNRRDAIVQAISLASEGDIIICAGKGPEKSLCFGTTEYDWDERAEIIKLFNESAFK